jgi:catechol 2,3-dioxygenase-like lactoylglutathione lyase family enzyme
MQLPSRVLPTREAHARLGCLLLISLLAQTLSAVGAPKTDVVVFTNGDRLTGEVKRLDHGQLSFDTDATGTISIEWERLDRMESIQVLQIELTSGERYAGQSVSASGVRKLRVELRDGSGVREVDFTDVVRVDPIGQGTLFERLDGYVTAGYDYTKANNLQTFTFTGGLSTRDERAMRSLDASTTITTQDVAEDSSRYDVSASVRRFLANRWFYQGFLGFEGNDELGLDLRTSLGGGYGYYLVQDSRQEWAVLAGLAATRENFATEDTSESLEAIVGTQYSFFRFDPEANLDASIYVLPSLTESGRVRSEAKLRCRYKIISDLFFEISLYGSYDNHADAAAESKSDYGMTTSLGYSF